MKKSENRFSDFFIFPEFCKYKKSNTQIFVETSNPNQFKAVEVDLSPQKV